MSAQKIVVLGTGGTIAGRAATAADNVGYVAGQVAVGDLLRGIPVPGGVEVEVEQVAQLDSKDMDHATWSALARRCAAWLEEPAVRGVVVTHGTDTMEETAYFLQAVLAPRKPVVLTGAMRPATSLAADGPQNLADALAVAATVGAMGVLVAFAGAVHCADEVFKAHSYRADAFGSGDAGPLGHVVEGVLRRSRAWPDRTVLRALDSLPAPDAWPRVEIVTSHAGASPLVVRALLTAGVDGIVVAGTGNGTVHRHLDAALQDAQRQGVAVRRASRCAQGPVLAPSGNLADAQANLSPAKARIALMLELMR